MSAATRTRQPRAFAGGLLMLICLSGPTLAQQAGSSTPSNENPASGQSDSQASQPEYWAIHAQLTNIWQYHPAFRSLFQGPQSLDYNNHTNETLDVTLYAGVSLWPGSEIWINPEIDQGMAPSDTLGVAGYVNGDGAKVGHTHPYVRFQRVFFRQTIDLDDDSEAVEPDLNQLGGTWSKDRLVITLGKFNVTDVFDTNKYAHDPKVDFLNWSLIDTGSYDYAADAWGYTYGAATEWYQGDWTARFGFFDLSTVPNGTLLTPNLSQFQLDGELEWRYEFMGENGQVAITTFLSRGRMGSFADALRLTAETETVPNTANVRRYGGRAGLSVNLEQSLTDAVALFARAGLDQDNIEPYEYTDIDRTIAVGISVTGKSWGRTDDTVAVAGVVNGIGRAHQAYLADGGLGILVGDGALPHPGAEAILEAYYNFSIVKELHLTVDSQLIDNPAYNRDRGPAVVVSGRLHAEI